MLLNWGEIRWDRKSLTGNVGSKFNVGGCFSKKKNKKEIAFDKFFFFFVSKLNHIQVFHVFGLIKKHDFIGIFGPERDNQQMILRE